MTAAKNKNKSLDEWLKSLETKHCQSIELGLNRIQKVYERCQLGKIARVVFTVTGTNGKGSTSAILSSICQSSGYQVAEFTSPYVIHFNDQIKINGVDATDDQIISAFKTIEKNLSDVTLTLFEYTTLAALMIFKKENVDVAILEVGMGGRHDAVNIIDTDCAIITTVDIDHTSWLGNDRESIAYEKAGIMRSTKPVIYGDIACPQSIKDYANDINADLLFADDFNQKKYPKPNILGDFQLKNAATAIKAIESMRSQLNVTDENIQHGLSTIELSGRLEVIAESPQVMVDVSHNKQAARALQKWLKEHPCQGKTIAVFSVLEDKNAADWLKYFSDNIDVWCISSADTERAMNRLDLLFILVDFAQIITSHSSIENAYKSARLMASAEDRIIVFGSFYTVNQVMQIHQ